MTLARCCGLLPLLMLLALPLPRALSAGFEGSATFVVLTSDTGDAATDDTLARQLAAQAEKYRDEISRQWLGEPLPRGIGRAIINLNLARDEKAFTWIKDHADRKFHTVYLTTTRENALGPLLKHEIAHVVLATEFPHPQSLPIWIEEGIASQYDDAPRQRERAQILRWFERSGNWPSLRKTVAAKSLHRGDQAGYAAAVSLTNYLLQKRGREVFMQFARTAAGQGTQAALQTHYGYGSLEQLQAEWIAWQRIQNRDGALAVSR